MQQLQNAGLRKRKIVFKDKNGGFNHLRETLEADFPKLKTQRGAFELLRADRGGKNRPLLSIPLTSTGYTIKDLKETVSGSVVIYVRPIQSNLDMTPNSAIRNGPTAYTQCVSCQMTVPICEMKQHTQDCGKIGQTSSHGNAANSATVTTQAKNIPKSDVVQTEPTVVDDKSNDLPYVDDDDSLFPTSDVKANWTEQLQTMLPDMPKSNIENAVNISVSLQEAASIVCDGINDDSSNDNERTKKLGKEEDVPDILHELAEKIQDSEYILTVDREEVWSGALAFYKKALVDTSKLWQDLTVCFSDEDGGAIKIEFFELLLKEINLRLFESQEMAPVRDSSKALLLKLAGVAISHSIIQGDPAFSCLSPAVYAYLAKYDADIIASYIDKDDVPKNAGTNNISELTATNKLISKLKNMVSKGKMKLTNRIDFSWVRVKGLSFKIMCNYQSSRHNMKV